MEPPPTVERARRSSDDGVPRLAVREIGDAAQLPFIPRIVTSTDIKSSSKIPPHASGTLRNRQRLSSDTSEAPSINLTAVVRAGEDRRLTGVSPKRVMKALASPSTQGVINSLKKESKGEGILRTISSRATEAWEKLDESTFLSKFSELKGLESINVVAVLPENKFKLVEEKFHAACKKHIPKMSPDERKVLLELYTRKGFVKRIELIVKTMQLNSMADDFSGEETLRNKTLGLVRQTDNTVALKGFAANFANSRFPIEKILRIIVSEQKDDSLNPRLLRFGVYLLSEVIAGAATTYGKILSDFLNKNNDNPNKPKFLVELNQELKGILAKQQSTYLAGQLVRELCWKCKDDPVRDPEKLTNTEQLTFEIAYGYFRFTTLDTLLSILSIAYFSVTDDPDKRILMLKLMTEIIRVTPPQKLVTVTEANLEDAIESATQNQHEAIKEEGLELKKVLGKFNAGIFRNRNPRLMQRAPSKSNILAEKAAMESPPIHEVIKWKDIVTQITTGVNLASYLLTLAHALKYTALEQLRVITVQELVGRKWENESIPSMSHHAEFAEKLRAFIQAAILNQEGTTNRARKIEFFIELISILSQTHDYSSGYIVYGALEHDFISRLSKTWKKVSPSSLQKWDEIKTLYELVRNNLIKHIRKLDEESYTLPLLKVRSDIVMNESKFPVMQGDNLNFDKLGHLADIIYLFLKCIKNKPEGRVDIDFIKLVKESAYKDEELEALSHKRESGKNLKEKIGSAITRKP